MENKEGRTKLDMAIVKGDVVFTAESVNGLVADEVNDGNRIKRADTIISGKFRPATEKIDAAYKEFNIALNRFVDLEAKIADSAKRASGSVRDSGEKLAQGLARIEKQANFSRLEQYVVLLERAASAMKTLSELESSGKLDKIAGALR